MGYLSDYYAAKDAERPDGSVDWNQVPVRNGGRLVTSHPEDTVLDPSSSDNPQLDHLLRNLDDSASEYVGDPLNPGESVVQMLYVEADYHTAQSVID